MPTIINPYGNQQTMGQDLFGLGGVADAFFGPKAATSAYTREKFREQQRQNAATLALPDAIIKGNQDEIVRQGIYAGLVPTTTYGYQQGRGVSQPGIDLATPQGQADVSKLMMAVPGTSFSSTPVGVGANLQKSYDIADMQSRRAAATQEAIANRTLVPTMGPTGPVYTRSVDAPGQRPVLTMPQEQGIQFGQNWPTGFTGLSPEQRAGINVEPKKPDWFNWVAPPLTPGGAPQRGTSTDGRTDDRTKQPLPDQYQLYTPGSQGAGTAASAFQPGDKEQRDYREAIRHADQTLQLGGKIIELVNRNPTAIGAVGNFRLMGQEGADLVNSLNVFFGNGKPGDYDQSVIQARFQLRQKYGDGVAKLIPELFDPDLNSVRTMNGMLLYKAAAALGQSGRDASDKDIMFVKGLTGDPSAWFQGPNTYKDKINTLMTIIQQQKNDDAGRLRTQSVIPPGGTSAPAATAAPGSGTTSTGVPWTVGP